MYTITIKRTGPDHAFYSPVKEYEIKDGILTISIDDDHDVVVPLFQVMDVDIFRHE